MSHRHLTEGVKFQLEASENKDVPFFFFSSEVTDPLDFYPWTPKVKSSRRLFQSFYSIMLELVRKNNP